MPYLCSCKKSHRTKPSSFVVRSSRVNESCPKCTVPHFSCCACILLVFSYNQDKLTHQFSYKISLMILNKIIIGGLFSVLAVQLKPFPNTIAQIDVPLGEFYIYIYISLDIGILGSKTASFYSILLRPSILFLRCVL